MFCVSAKGENVSLNQRSTIWEKTTNLMNRILCSKWLVLAPFGLYLFLAIIRAYTRMPFVDEGWDASPAVNLVRHGFMGTTIFPVGSVGYYWGPHAFQGMEQHTYWLPPLYFLAEGLIFKLFGVGLFQLRLMSVFWGVVGLAAVYYLARWLFKNDRRLVLLSLILVGTDYFWIDAASLGRMDMMAVALSLVAFALYLNLRKRNLYWAILSSNLFICLSGLTHPTGVLGLLVLVFLLLYLDRKSLEWRMVLIGLVPYVLGAVGWGVYIMQDFEAFKIQFFGNVFHTQTFSGSAVTHELTDRYLNNYGIGHYGIGGAWAVPAIGKPLILAFFFLALIGAPFVVKSKRGRLMWGMLVITFLGLIFLGDKAHYLAWITPLFLLNAVTVCAAVKWMRLVKLLFVVAFCYIILYSTYWDAGVLRYDDYHNKYLADLNQFNSYYYSGGKLYGSSEIAFFYDFHDDIFQDDSTLGLWTGVKPEYFIVDPVWYQGAFSNLKKKHPDDWNYVNTTLSNEYTVIFQGKYYTFYEKKS